MSITFDFEENLARQGYSRIAGVDEAGRGPLAGPVVAAAVILLRPLPGLNDSKKLSAKQREALFEQLILLPHGIGIVHSETIDRINILQATFLAMQDAVRSLSPDYLLIDGNQLPKINLPKRAIVEGDALSFSIAAASIIAKVTRDKLMEKYDAQFPEYGFKKHKGYATADHIAAIYKHGPCPIHRMTFDPIYSLTTQPQLF